MRPLVDAPEWAHRARARGLPYPVADAIARLVAGMTPDETRRAEVFEELVSHFQDGLAAGRSAGELLGSFGHESVAMDLLRTVERQRLTPSSHTPVPVSLRRRIAGMLSFSRDIRHGARRLLASPVFTLTAVLSLALGVGATTTVFSLLNAVLLRPTPVQEPEELVSIYEKTTDFPWGSLSYPNYVDLERGTTEVFSAVSASRFVLVQQDQGGVLRNIIGEAVSGDYFPVLGLAPAAGRLLGPEDDVAPGAHPVVVLDYGHWQDAYDGDPAVVGRTLRLNNRDYTIVGVAPEGYRGIAAGIVPQVYASIAMADHLNPGDGSEFTSRGSHGLFVKARLRPGATQVQAEAAAMAVVADLRVREAEEWGPDRTFAMVPSSEVIFYPSADGALMTISGLLLVVVGLVLLVVCANLASFLLARGLDRRREIAVRLALGATRGALVRQLVTETVLLGLLGGVAGLGVAMGLGKLLTTADLPLPLPVTIDLSLDWRVLVFTAVVSLVAGVLLGLMPALRASRPELSQTLRDESPGSTGGRGRVTLSHALVGAQVAFSLVLLVAAGLFVRSLQQREQVDPGFGREPAGLLQVVFAGEREEDMEARQARRLQEQEELATRIRAIPGVRSVGMIDNIHLNLLNQTQTSIAVPGVEPPPGYEQWTVEFATVDTAFFQAAGMRLLQGRGFSAVDTREAPRVAVINQALAERFWPDQDAVGQRFTRNGREHTVVGVVETAKVRSLGEAPRPVLYAALGQVGSSSVWYVAQTAGDDEATAQAMLGALREMGRDELMPAEVRTMRRHQAIMMLPLRLGVVAVASLAVLALVLAAIGLYGSVSYAVARRTREVGIRLALGAEMGAVVRLLMGTGLRVVAVGTLVGLALALVVARLMAGLLYGVSAMDPVTFGVVPALLLGVAALAAWLPARRALGIHPSSALRSE